MIITTSNILLGVTPSNVSTGASSDDPAGITDPDFSTNYTSSDQFRLTVDFGVTTQISYVAVAGINIATSGDLTSDYTRVYDGDELITTTYISRNHCTVMTFESRSFTNLRVVLKTEEGLSNPRITFCAAGNHFTLPNNGEEAGYLRAFLKRSYKNKTTLNDQAGPVAILRKKIAIKVRLNKPNLTKEFTENEWQDFLDFAEFNYFFIREQEDSNKGSAFTGENNSAYLCYDAMRNDIKSHGQTRKLNTMSLGFSVFNGL